MKKTKKQLSSVVIPILVGVIAMLVVLIGIMAYSVINQKMQKAPAAPSVRASAVPAVEKKQWVS